ncbi:MAG: hypothetical protein KIS88_04130 [Anaerolineales bacterium]|nr:hypothetical protein [Anaerolineales bacterium]
MDNQRFLTDGLQQLPAYLQSDEVFWPMERDPQLTLGNLLLAAATLDAEGKLRPVDASALANVKKEWGVAWKKKAEREFTARLRQWSHYLAELADNPKQHALYYASEVRPRVLLQLLGEAPELADKVDALDAALRPLVQPADFLWDAKLADAFPAPEYWFLRVVPKPPDEDE